MSGDAARTPRDRRPAEPSLLGLVFLATFTVGLNATMMSVALPTVSADLGATATQSTWVLLVYGLVSTALLVPFGHVSDVVDRRLLFLVAVALTAVGGVVVAAAPGPALLIDGRAVQAVGAAVLLTNAAVILAGVFPGVRLGRAMGFYLAGFSTGHVVGPVLAGVVTTVLDWRWLFWLNVPLGAVTLLWGRSALRGLAPTIRPDRLGIDVVGSVSIMVGLGGLLLALSRAPYVGWGDPVVLAELAVAVVAVAPLPWWLRRTPDPAIDPALFDSRDFRIAFLASCVVIWPRLATGALVALYVQGVEGGTPLQAAAVIAPLAVAVTVASLRAGWFLRRWSEEMLAFSTILLTASGAAVLLLSVASRWTTALQVVGVIAVGAGSGLFGAVNSSMLIRLAPPDAVGRTNSVRTLGTNGSYAVGLAMGLTVVTLGLSAPAAKAFFSAGTDLLGPSDVAALMLGYRLFWSLLVALLVVVAAATWRTRPAVPRPGTHLSPPVGDLSTVVPPHRIGRSRDARGREEGSG